MKIKVLLRETQDPWGYLVTLDYDAVDIHKKRFINSFVTSATASGTAQAIYDVGRAMLIEAAEDIAALQKNLFAADKKDAKEAAVRYAKYGGTSFRKMHYTTAEIVHGIDVDQAQIENGHVLIDIEPFDIEVAKKVRGKHEVKNLSDLDAGDVALIGIDPAKTNQLDPGSKQVVYKLTDAEYRLRELIDEKLYPMKELQQKSKSEIMNIHNHSQYGKTQAMQDEIDRFKHENSGVNVIVFDIDGKPMQDFKGAKVDMSSDNMSITVKQKKTNQEILDSAINSLMESTIREKDFVVNTMDLENPYLRAKDLPPAYGGAAARAWKTELEKAASEAVPIDFESSTNPFFHVNPEDEPLAQPYVIYPKPHSKQVDAYPITETMRSLMPGGFGDQKVTIKAEYSTTDKTSLSKLIKLAGIQLPKKIDENNTNPKYWLGNLISTLEEITKGVNNNLDDEDPTKIMICAIAELAVNHWKELVQQQDNS